VLDEFKILLGEDVFVEVRKPTASQKEKATVKLESIMLSSLIDAFEG
jgi:hypothetical protein